MPDLTREDLLALTPETYLAPGFLDAAGALRPQLVSEAATAAAMQLTAADLAPQELAFTYEALRALLPLQTGTPHERMEHALADALATVGRMIRQPNNQGLVSWSQRCIAFVEQSADIDAFLTHMRAVLRLQALIVNLPPPGELPEDEEDEELPSGPSSSGPVSPGLH